METYNSNEHTRTPFLLFIPISTRTANQHQPHLRAHELVVEDPWERDAPEEPNYDGEDHHADGDDAVSYFAVYSFL